MADVNERIAQLEESLANLISQVDEIKRALNREDVEKQEAKTVDEWFDNIKKRTQPD